MDSLTTVLTETDMGCCQDFAWKCGNCSELWTLIEGTPEDNLYRYCPNCGYSIIDAYGSTTEEFPDNYCQECECMMKWGGQLEKWYCPECGERL